MTCEGFCKLLANRCRLESREKIAVTYLLIAYTTTSRQEKPTPMAQKLLACLNSFFHVYKRVNLAALVDSFLPTLKFLVLQQTSMNVMRHLAKFFYFLTGDTINQRQLLMLSVTREILDNIDDLMYIQRLIEVLVEFRVHQCDVGSVQLLNQLYDHLQLILVGKEIFCFLFCF